MRNSQEDLLLKKLGWKLTKLRKQSGFTQEGLADLAGFSRSYYTEIESGKRNLSILNLAKISSVLQCSLRDLIDGIEENDYL